MAISAVMTGACSNMVVAASQEVFTQPLAWEPLGRPLLARAVVVEQWAVADRRSLLGVKPVGGPLVVRAQLVPVEEPLPVPVREPPLVPEQEQPLVPVLGRPVVPVEEQSLVARRPLLGRQPLVVRRPQLGRHLLVVRRLPLDRLPQPVEVAVALLDRLPRPVEVAVALLDRLPRPMAVAVAEPTAATSKRAAQGDSQTLAHPQPAPMSDVRWEILKSAQDEYP